MAVFVLHHLLVYKMQHMTRFSDYMFENGV